MTPILRQFLSEARDFLEGISDKLIALESDPENVALMGELFRLVHTLKGNCGLFDFPEMSRVLHAAEDVMVVVRDGDLAYSQRLADCLLDAMDFVSLLLDEIEESGTSSATHVSASAKLAQSLRQLISMPDDTPVAPAGPGEAPTQTPTTTDAIVLPPFLCEVPEALRMAWYAQGPGRAPLLGVSYTPESECFFKGEDPFFQVRQTPQSVWQRVTPSAPWPALAEFDAYHCTLTFQLVSTASRLDIETHFRYVPEQINLVEVPLIMLALPVGEASDGGPVYEDFVNQALAHLARGDAVGLKRAAGAMLGLLSADLWTASALRWLLLILEQEPQNQPALRAMVESLRTFAAPVWETAPVHPLLSTQLLQPKMSVQTAQPVSMTDSVINAQLAVLGLADWLPGRVKAVATTLTGCYRSMGREALLPALNAALAASLAQASVAPMLTWLKQQTAPQTGPQTQPVPPTQTPTPTQPVSLPPSLDKAPVMLSPEVSTTQEMTELMRPVDGESRTGRRAEEATGGPKTLKVEQEKIDRLMNLIGEMVVAKNGLPYLAVRAETVFGVRELSREIKSQYAVINRIAEEMQDAIMQVRMLPVSFVFQRFPRLVRDISRKLGKAVHLVLEGEDTEADKNIIEALADPLIHIVRNSLDHGFESPDARRAVGKPAEGCLRIRASQEAGRVIIDIHDDGKGIDPAVIKRKAYEKGLIDEALLERISDQEAVNLVFAAGLSTVDVVSDLSGRGVGMDVVRTAVERVNGTVTLESRVGQGTHLRLSLPLSMAVTNVMIIESDGQIFGVPMDLVVETVRIPRSVIHTIKNHQTAVLRGRIVPLRSLNEMLATDQPQKVNEADELATLVIRLQGEHVGIVVDDFREVVDIILKPMNGILASLPGYTGSALLGDGSVLMVLNLKELV